MIFPTTLFSPGPRRRKLRSLRRRACSIFVPAVLPAFLFCFFTPDAFAAKAKFISIHTVQEGPAAAFKAAFAPLGGAPAPELDAFVRKNPEASFDKKDIKEITAAEEGGAIFLDVHFDPKAAQRFDRAATLQNGAEPAVLVNGQFVDKLEAGSVLTDDQSGYTMMRLHTEWSAVEEAQAWIDANFKKP